MHKSSPLYPIIFSSENLIEKKDLKLNLDNKKKIFSLNEYSGQTKKFNSTFKSYFLYTPPSVSNFKAVSYTHLPLPTKA